MDAQQIDWAAAGSRSFEIGLDDQVASLLAPAGGYFVSVFPVRKLENGTLESGTPEIALQPAFATLGAPAAPTSTPAASASLDQGDTLVTISVRAPLGGCAECC